MKTYLKVLKWLFIFYWLIISISPHIFSQKDSTILSSSYSVHQQFEISDIRTSYVSYAYRGEFDKIELSAYKPDKTELNVLLLMEKEMLLLFKKDYDNLLKTFMENEEKYYKKRNNRTFIFGYIYDNTPLANDEHFYKDSLNTAFYNYLTLNSHTYKYDINNSYLTDEEKQFLNFYIDLLIYYGDECLQHYEDNVLESGRKLVKIHPDSPYSKVAKKYKRYDYSISDWGWQASIPIITSEFPLNGETYKTMGPPVNIPYPLSLDLGWNYKNYLLQVEGGMAFTYERAVLTNNEKDENYGIPMFRGAVIGGYSFHLGDKYTITPFVGRRNLFMTIRRPDHGHNEFKAEDAPSKYYRFKFSSRNWMYGVMFDFNLNNSYECNNRISRDFHRITLGMSHIDVPLGNTHINSSMLLIKYAFGIQYQRRKGMARY